MLLAIACADAYAMATEYIKLPKDRFVRDEALKFKKYLKHPVHNLRPGQYTDDTQMSIAVAETLIAGDLSKEAFAESFVRCYKRDRRDGYARGFQSFLNSVDSGKEFLEKIRPKSDKNGAAMRSVPIGVLKSPEEIVRVAETQARITHDTPDGVLSSQLVALMSHFSMYSSSPMRPRVMTSFLAMALPGKLQEISSMLPRWKGPVTGPKVGMKTVHAVFDLVTSGKSLVEMMKQTIEWGGDTDSVAAIAWGISSARSFDELPDFMEPCLEPGGKYGYKFLKDLGEKLVRGL
jgi:ADP-ribosylglycohydrolase